jgi:acyl-CoA synthetase (NDP forming)
MPDEINQFRNVSPLLQPESMAIVGASETGGEGWSKVLFNNIKEAGFPLRVYLINPSRDELWDQKVYPDFSALPEQVDHAAVVVPGRFVNGVIKNGIENGLKAATIFSAGFGEGRKKLGTERGAELRAMIQEAGLAACGPNCMGTFSLPRKLLQYPTTRLRNLQQGPVGGIFHSGGTLGYWFAQAAQRGLGFSYAVSCGNEFGLDCADYLNFLVDDPDTEIIVGMLESIRRPKAFMEAAGRAFEAGKPVVLIKLGRTELGKEQAATHTGAVAVDDDVFQAMCNKYGITRCNNLDDMVEIALAFTQKRYPTGRKMAIVTSSGGAVGLSLDAVDDAGATLATLSPATVERMEEIVPEDVDVYNPMDAGTALAGNVERFCRLSKAFADEDDVDIMAIQARLPIPGDPYSNFDIYADLIAYTDKPIFGFSRMAQNANDSYRDFQKRTGLPCFFGIPQTVRAMQALVRYGAVKRRGVPALPAPGGDAANVAEGALEAALDAAGLTAPKQEQTGPTPEDAAAAAGRIGFPVALKIVSAQFSHKTEAGGVRLNLADADAVAAEAADLLASLPEGSIDGFLVQEMVDGFEMLVGMRDDPDFGPLVVVGLGGVFVELMKDVSLRLAPVTADDAKEMIAELRSAAALDGFRGQAPRDVKALADAIASLSAFFVDHRTWLSDIEINPLIVLEDGRGVRAIDVRPVRKS